MQHFVDSARVCLFHSLHATMSIPILTVPFVNYWTQSVPPPSTFQPTYLIPARKPQCISVALSCSLAVTSHRNCARLASTIFSCVPTSLAIGLASVFQRPQLSVVMSQPGPPVGLSLVLLMLLACRLCVTFVISMLKIVGKSPVMTLTS